MIPQPYTHQQPPAPKDTCRVDCEHSCHGLACRVPGCVCASSVPELVALEHEDGAA